MKSPFRFGAAYLAIAVTSLPASAGRNGGKPNPVPYVPSGTPGVYVRNIPSAPPMGTARQIYLKPGASIPAVPLPTRARSVDTRYTQSFPGPFNTTILMIDPALAIYDTAHVTPQGKVKRECVRLPAATPARPASRSHPAASKSKGAAR